MLSDCGGKVGDGMGACSWVSSTSGPSTSFCFALSAARVAPITGAACPDRLSTSRVRIRTVNWTHGLDVQGDHRGTCPTKPSGGLSRVRAMYSPPRRSNFTTTFLDSSRMMAWVSLKVKVMPRPQTRLTDMSSRVTLATWSVLLILRLPSDCSRG